MDVRSWAEPGSPQSLDTFHTWCRAVVCFVVLDGHMPALLFADGPGHDEPAVAAWELKGEPPPLDELVADTLHSWADEQQASQVAICIPFGGDDPGLYLLSIDETGALAERAFVSIDEDGASFKSWEPMTTAYAANDWHRFLAGHAGYDDFTKWRCRQCESVCPGEAAVMPSPCDFCGSNDIEEVALPTLLARPKPPWDANYDDEDGALALGLPFMQTLLGLMRRG